MATNIFLMRNDSSERIFKYEDDKYLENICWIYKSMKIRMITGNKNVETGIYKRKLYRQQESLIPREKISSAE